MEPSLLTVGTITRISPYSIQWRFTTEDVLSHQGIPANQSIQSPEFVIGKFNTSPGKWLLTTSDDDEAKSAIANLSHISPINGQLKPVLEWKITGDIKNKTMNITKCTSNCKDFLYIDMLYDKFAATMDEHAMVISLKWKIDIDYLINTPNASQLSDDLLRMYESGLNTDVTLVSSEGRELVAHRVLLAARSPVFAAMLNHDTLENQTGRVIIADIAQEVLQEVLFFIYSGKEPEKMSTLCEEILQAADKYGVEMLKTMCESHLSHGLDLANLQPKFKLAEHYSCQLLEKRCVEFAIKNLKQWKQSAHWNKDIWKLSARVLAMILDATV